MTEKLFGLFTECLFAYKENMEYEFYKSKAGALKLDPNLLKQTHIFSPKMEG